MHSNRSAALILCLLFSICEFPSISNGKEMFLGTYEIPNRKTTGPINIVTEKAIKGNYSPLILRGMKNNRVKLINTGNAVELRRIDSFPLTVSGGVFQSADLYKFAIIKFLWTDNEKGNSASTVNGVGYPLEAAIYLFNERYETYENSLNYRDGLATLILHISICLTTNELFSDFAKELKKILKPGNSTQVQLDTSMKWYDTVPENVKYYAYPGEYRNLENNKSYYCESVLIPDYPAPCISHEQFEETFGSMKNSLGEPLTVTETVHPFKQPVIQAEGIIQIIL